MLRRVYSKYKDEKEVFKLNKEYTLKELLYLFAIEGSKLKWIDEKQKYEVITRNDRYIIVAKPYNLQKDCCKYSILDLENMECSTDNLVFGIYNYLNKKDCEEALKDLEKENMELSRRRLAKIENVVSEVWINISFRKLSNYEKDN